MSKLLPDLKTAFQELGVQDGMWLSFHHHMRNGDFVLNHALKTLADMGLKDLKINASAIFDCHEPIIELIKQGVVTEIHCNYMGAKVGKAISDGVMEKPVIFRTHGGRPWDIARGASPIDLAIIAAPTADPRGNLTGKYGPSACGSLGYAFADAEHAKKVLAVTDNLVPHPLAEYSIPEWQVDAVVEMDAIGDPKGIVSGTTQVTRDPIGLLMAQQATKAIVASGLLKDGFSFQTGAGGASLATAAFLHEKMLEDGIKGSFGMGGITGYLVKMLEDGCFQSLMDVQCFDLDAVASIRTNPKHREVSGIQYAAPCPKGSLVDSLDVVILGATEMDTNFNVNVHTDSQGSIMGGSGGHSDTAAGAKMAMIIAPLVRARMPLVVDEVQCVSTPGETIDVLVTQYGIAVNPRRDDLKEKFLDAGLPVKQIHELKAIAEQLTGTPKTFRREGRVVAEVMYRTGEIISKLRTVK